MELVISELHLRLPPWRFRNKTIAEKFLEPNKTVLDLGCGAKNLLQYYKPSKYLGIDGMPLGDIQLDLDKDFHLQIKPGWDYCVNSGILEYVDFPEKFLIKQKTLAKEYIFTWWQGTTHGRMNNDAMQQLIEINYQIIYKEPWGSQMIFKCIPK
jgi:hypothetical protein